ncbi:MAG: hypothetical protein ACMUHX_03505 [bacterium]
MWINVVDEKGKENLAKYIIKPPRQPEADAMSWKTKKVVTCHCRP